MQTTYLWGNFSLRGNKITALVILILFAFNVSGQSKLKSRRSDRIEQRKWTYGFLFGGSLSFYQVAYSDRFTTPDYDTLHSVMPVFTPGLSVGLLVNVKLNSVLDLRLMPQAAFYSHKLDYNYTSRNTIVQTVQSASIEFPLLLKYRSMRRENVRMYMVGGIAPSIEISGQNDKVKSEQNLAISRGNLMLQVGAGLDIYFPFFKMSPEIRYSQGVLNILNSDEGVFNAPLKRINTGMVSFHLIFQ